MEDVEVGLPGEVSRAHIPTKEETTLRPHHVNFVKMGKGQLTVALLDISMWRLASHKLCTDLISPVRWCTDLRQVLRQAVQFCLGVKVAQVAHLRVRVSILTYQSVYVSTLFHHHHHHCPSLILRLFDWILRRPSHDR